MTVYQWLKTLPEWVWREVIKKIFMMHTRQIPV